MGASSSKSVLEPSISDELVTRKMCPKGCEKLLQNHYWRLKRDMIMKELKANNFFYGIGESFPDENNEKGILCLQQEAIRNGWSASVDRDYDHYYQKWRFNLTIEKKIPDPLSEFPKCPTNIDPSLK